MTGIFTYELDGIRISVARHGESLAAAAAQRAFIGLGIKKTPRVFDQRPTGVEHIIEHINPCPLCGGGLRENGVEHGGGDTVSHYECLKCNTGVQMRTFPLEEGEDGQD